MKKKIVYYGLLTILIGVFAFSAYKLGDYWLAKIKSDKLNSELSMFVGVGENTEKDPSASRATRSISRSTLRHCGKNMKIL